MEGAVMVAHLLEGCGHSSSLAQVASYEFTTLTCIPGVVRFRGAKIQLLDLPGIIEGAKDGKGRGRQVRALLDAVSEGIGSDGWTTAGRHRARPGT